MLSIPAHRRIGRVELRNMLIVYFITLPFQLITNGSLLQQGSTVLVVLTAIHAALVATLFWALLANALVSTQIVEDGTMASLAVCALFTALIQYLICSISPFSSFVF